MPDANRPFKIPGGLPMAWFAAIVSTVVFVLLFIPKNPVFMGTTATIMFFGWMAIGIILYICNMGERKKIDPKTRENNLYQNASK